MNAETKPLKDVSSTTGIVIRQSMDRSDPVLTNSPDLIVTGPGAAFDTSVFTDPNAYDWYFSQPPVNGSANYVYIRGVNYTPTGTQNSRVYLYYAQSDQLLDPTQWKSSGFTVAGVSQNYTPINAVSQYQMVIPPAPVMWTPPAPTTAGATYFLIAWVDNAAQPTPPTFPSTPFANLAALTTYISQNPQMAVLDTIYRGAFLRQFPGQTASNDGTGAQTSPDILAHGTLAAQDASAYTSAASYGSSTLVNTAVLGARNFIYVRALNTRNGPGKSRVYLYWATTTAISPPSWQITNFSYAGNAQNWVDLQATSAGQVMVSTVPLVWTPPPLPSGQSCVLIAYVDNSASPTPPDFTPFGYLTESAVASFVAGHPQLAWLSTASTSAPAVTMSWEMALNAGPGGTFYAGVQLKSIPTDGTLTLSIPGPDAANTVVMSSLKVPDPNVLMAWPVSYPNGFATSAVLTYTQGATAPGPGASISAVLLLGGAGGVSTVIVPRSGS